MGDMTSLREDGMHKFARSLMHMLRVAMLVMLASVLSGWSSCADGTTDNPPAACQLPDPEDGYSMPLPPLTEDQKPRMEEVCQLITQVWQTRGYVRKATKQMPESGDLIDCMLGSSVAGSDATPPPPPLPDAMLLPEGVLRQRMEVEDH